MKLVIVGNGMAADAFLNSWTERSKLSDESWDVTVFGEERFHAYNRVQLVDVLTRRKTVENILLKTTDWYEKNGIFLRQGIRIARIDSQKKIVIDDSGAESKYDKVLLAVGAQAFIPPVPGAGLGGVFVLRTLEDVRRVSEKIRGAQRAIVLGGGLLGLEAAKGLFDAGVRVMVLHLKDQVMDQQLDRIGGALLKKEIERLGIEIRLNSTISEIQGSDSITGVCLNSGESIATDLLLICAGITPNTQLAVSSGINVGRGILVDDHLETNSPGVFAIGDAIEHRGLCYGLVAPLIEQARVAAHNILRKPEENPLTYAGTKCATTLKVSGIAVASAGSIQGGNDFEEYVELDTRRGVYRKLILQGDRLLGAILVGDVQGSSKILGLIESGEPLTDPDSVLIGNKENSASLPVADDREIICTCHSVTRGTILSAIKTRELKTREEVARHTKASTGCGSCAQAVTDLMLQKEKSPKTAMTVPSIVPTTPEPAGARTLLTEYPPNYPKALEIERIKKEGLGLDFKEIFEKGVQALTEDDFYRLKTYGICSQKHPGFFMLRIRVPGGRLTSGQAKVIADLAARYGGGWAHITTRQNVELHWVRLKDVRAIWNALESVGLSTRSSCGHTMRNVIACPHSLSPDSLLDVAPLAHAISDYFVHRSDIINPGLPNRLNIVFSACPECDADVYINDIGFRAIPGFSESGNGKSFGFELWAGGSLGAHPVLGFRLKEFLPVKDVLAACQAIFEIYAKYGNRNKAKSRLKWLVEQWGEDKFSAVFERVFQEKRSLPENPDFSGFVRPPKNTFSDFAWLQQTPQNVCLPQRQAGKNRIPVAVPLGDLRAKQLSAIAMLAQKFGEDSLQLTKEQNIEFQNVSTRQAPKIIKSMRRMGLSFVSEKGIPAVVACPGTEFCVLAVTDSQGAAHSLLNNFRAESVENEEILKGVTIAVSG